jgi:hypothetical protein
MAQQPLVVVVEVVQTQELLRPVVDQVVELVTKQALEQRAQAPPVKVITAETLEAMVVLMEQVVVAEQVQPEPTDLQHQEQAAMAVLGLQVVSQAVQSITQVVVADPLMQVVVELLDRAAQEVVERAVMVLLMEQTELTA